MKKRDKIIITVYSLILILAFISQFIQSNKFIAWSSIILLLFFYFFSICVVIYFYILNKKDAKNSNEISNLIGNNELLRANELINNNLKEAKHYISDIKYKMKLVSLKLIQGNDNEAKVIIDNNKWGTFEKQLYYYKVLLSLKDHNIGNAILYKDKLVKTNNKLRGKRKDYFKEQILNIEIIMESLKSGEKGIVKSQLPIVKEIMDNIN